MMSEVLVIVGPTALEGPRPLPAGAFALASAVRRAGHQPRVLDTQAEPLGFGLVAERMLRRNLRAVALLAADGQAIEVARFARFIRQISPGMPIACCGVIAGLEGLWSPGSTDVVLSENIDLGLARWLGGIPADASTSADVVGEFDLAHYTLPCLGRSQPSIELAMGDPYGGSGRRSLAEVMRDLAAIHAAGAIPLLSGVEFWDADGASDVLGTLRSRNDHWCLRASLAWVSHVGTSALQQWGCSQVWIEFLSAETGSASESADMALALSGGGTSAILGPVLFAPGETLGSLRATAQAVLGAQRGLSVSAIATRVPIGVGAPTPLPESLLADIPLPTQHLLKSPERLVELMSETLASLVLAAMTPSTLFASLPQRDALVRAVTRIRPLIDGSRTVRDICRAAGEAGWTTSIWDTLLALALCGFVRGRSLAAPSTFFCSRPWTGFEIGEEDGLVRFCCWARDAYGDVNQASIPDIWNGHLVQSMRTSMAQGRIEDVCRSDCPYILGWMRDTDPVAPAGHAFQQNLALSGAEIEDRVSVLRSKPRYWRVTHSALCNLDCVMCYQDRKSEATLPESFYAELVGYYDVMHEIVVVGGEPLVIKRLRHLIGEFPSHRYPDAHFAVITNGTIFDPRTLALFDGKPISWVVVSIDAARDGTFSYIRRPGRLQHVLNGVRAWRDLSERRMFDLVLSFTVMRDNVEELAEFVVLAGDLGVDCQFSLVSGDKGGQDHIDPIALRSARDRALAAIRKNPGYRRLKLARASLETLVRS